MGKLADVIKPNQHLIWILCLVGFHMEVRLNCASFWLDSHHLCAILLQYSLRRTPEETTFFNLLPAVAYKVIVFLL